MAENEPNTPPPPKPQDAAPIDPRRLETQGVDLAAPMDGATPSILEYPPASARKAMVSDKLLMVLATFATVTLRLGTQIIMARLVSRSDYGLYTLVLSAPAIVTSLGDLVVSTSIIQIRDRDEQEIFDTGLVIVLALGSLYACAFLASGAALYLYSEVAHHDWRVIPLAAIQAAITVLSMTYNVQLARLNRRREFRSEVAQGLIFSFSATASAIGLGLAHAGVFALAMQSLVAQLCANVAIQRRIPLGVPRRATRACLMRLVKLGGTLTPGNYLTNLEAYTFNFAIYRSAPPQPDVQKQRVGEWDRGIKVEQLLAENINASLNRVVYTTLCAAQDDLPRFREIAMRSMEILLLLNLLSAALIYSSAAPLIRLMLGPNWAEVVPILRVLGFSIPAGALFQMGYSVAFARGRPAPLTFWTAGRSLVLIPVLFLFGFQHPLAIAWVYVISRSIHAIGLMCTTWYQIGLPPASSFWRMGVMAVAAVATAIAMSIVDSRVLQGQPLARVAVTGAAGLTLYLAMIALLAPSVLRYVIRMSRGR